MKLSRKIFPGLEESTEQRLAVNAMPHAEVERVMSQLHGLIVADLLNVLSGSNPTVQGVTKSLETLLGDTSLPSWGPGVSNTPFAEFADLGVSRTLAVAYGILRGGGAIPNSRSYLEFYALDGGAWHLQASAPSEFDGKSFYVSSLRAGLAREVWLLAWGKILGDPGGRLNARLYSFDGNKLRTIWGRSDLARGRIEVSGPSVTLIYDKEYPSFEIVRETLYVTSKGLE